MLTTEQREVLIAFLIPRIPANPSPGTIAIFVGDDIAAEMPTASYVREIPEWMVRRAMRQSSPALMIRVIRAADNQDAGFAPLVAFADALSADPIPWQEWARAQGLDGSFEGDPLHVEDGRPFVDRGGFRQRIPRLDSLDSPGCLLVEGDLGSGKTYLSEYCKRLSSHWDNFNVGFTEVSTSQVREFTPQMAAFDLVTGLQTRFQFVPREHEEPHRYARNLVAWIGQYSPLKPLPSMAIFDGFDAPGLPEPVRTFVEELIRSVQEDESVRRRLRVILLGYDASRLQERGLAFERCVLEHVDGPDIDEWFRRKFPSQPDYRYEETVTMIGEQLPASGDSRLRMLCDLVRVATAQFEAL